MINESAEPAQLLGELVELQRGYDLTSVQRKSGTVPVFGSAGQNGFHNQAKVKGPGVVIGRSGASYGRVHYSESDFWPHNTVLFVKNFKGNDPRFVFYFLKTIDLKSLNSGSVQPSLNRNYLYGIPVTFPKDPLEQASIARILATIDAKITLNRQINRTLENIAQAIFRSWFVDFDPVKAKAKALATGKSLNEVERAGMAAIAGKTIQELDDLSEEQRRSLTEVASLFPSGFESSEGIQVPQNWSAKPLYSTATFVNGLAFKASDFTLDRSGLPVVKIAELKNGISQQTKFTVGQHSNKYQITNGDVLYSWSGSPETSLNVFKWFGSDGWLNQHIFKVVTQDSSQKHFVFFLLRQLKPQLIDIAKNKQTTGLGHVTVSDMKRLFVPYPDKSVLTAFSKIAGPLFQAASIREQESLTLAKLRDCILPQLLSGKLPLPLDAAAEDKI